MATNVNQTTRQDLPEHAQPYGNAFLQNLVEYLYNAPAPDANGITNWFKPNPGGTGGNGTTLDLSGGAKTYQQMGGPTLPGLTPFNQLDKSGQQYAINQIFQNQPISDSSNQFIQNALGGPTSDMANNYESYMTGGPLAGASRSSLLDALMGPTQQAGYQSLLDSMQGSTANAAQQSAYNQLGGPGSQMADDASLFSFSGPLSGAARSQSQNIINGSQLNNPLFGSSQNQLNSVINGSAYNNPLFGAANSRALDTIQGRYLDPATNPYLTANYNTAAKAVGDNYKYATAPSTDAQFARAGSFGGSAHQQTAAMQQFDMGRNMTDLANQMYGQNYSNERQNQVGATQNAQQQYQQNQQNQLAASQGAQGLYAQMLQNQLGAIGNERGYTQSALDSALNRNQSTQENALQRALSAGTSSVQGQQSLLDNQLTRGMQGAEGQLGRGVQVESILPQLLQSSYMPADILRSLGGEQRNMQDQNNQIDYQNQQQAFQYPFKLYDILGSGLASYTGGGGVTTQTSSNPNSLGAGAQAVGLGALGAGALSNIGSWLYPQKAAETVAGATG